MKTTFAGGLGVAVLALAPSFAQADGHGNDSFGTLSANIGVASEYVFRGLPSSNNSAQVSAGLDWNLENFYVGTWLSNTNDTDLGNEVDLYAGITAGDFDFGAIIYAYPADGDTDGAGPDGGSRDSKLTEVYVGYNHGMLSTYAWYGAGAYGRTDDDYVYLEANVTGPVTENSELSFHAGYQIFHGDDFNKGGQRKTDQQIDLALTLAVGDLWFSISSILGNDDNLGVNERPRINAGYSWTFEDLLPINLSF